MTDAATFWDKVATKYAKSPVSDVPAYEYTLERTRSYLSPSAHMLEIGCGTGSTALALADAVKQVTATDFSQEMIALGKEKARIQGISNVDFQVKSVNDPSLSQGTYDVVMAMNLLHLIEDLPGALAQINNALKPGGIFISKTFCRPVLRPTFKFIAIRAVLPVMQFFGKAPFVSFMRIEFLEAAITAAGFSIVETGNYPANPPSRFIVAKKE